MILSSLATALATAEVPNSSSPIDDDGSKHLAVHSAVSHIDGHTSDFRLNYTGGSGPQVNLLNYYYSKAIHFYAFLRPAISCMY